LLYALLNGKKVKAKRDLPRSKEFKCPIENCISRELILKKGNYKIPHFAHKKKNDCAKYSEPESQAHLAMKECLETTLGIDKKFVEYSRIKGVRPDLVWKSTYAIEVQHSPISPEEIDRRNNIYFINNLIPVWIFHKQEENDEAFFNRGQYRRFHRHNTYNSTNIEDEYIYRLSSAERHVLEIQGSLFFLEFSKKSIIPCEEKNNSEINIRFDLSAGPRFDCIDYMDYRMTGTLYKEGKKLHVLDEKTLEKKLEELSPKIYDYCSNNAWYLELSEPIPAKIRNKLMLRANYCCEECREPFLVRNVFKIINKLLIAWEGFPCSSCKKKTLMVYDKSYYIHIEESTNNKSALSAFFPFEYTEGYQVNHCADCGTLQEKKHISDWMNFYKHNHRHSVRFHNKPPRMVSEVKIETLIDKTALKPIKKEVLYHFTYRDKDPRNKAGENIKLLCWRCYYESPNFFYDSSYRRHRI
jgi:hypothetical protein